MLLTLCTLSSSGKWPKYNIDQTDLIIVCFEIQGCLLWVYQQTGNVIMRLDLRKIYTVQLKFRSKYQHQWWRVVGGVGGWWRVGNDNDDNDGQSELGSPATNSSTTFELNLWFASIWAETSKVWWINPQMDTWMLKLLLCPSLMPLDWYNQTVPHWWYNNTFLVNVAPFLPPWESADVKQHAIQQELHTALYNTMPCTTSIMQASVCIKNMQHPWGQEPTSQTVYELKT